MPVDPVDHGNPAVCLIAFSWQPGSPAPLVLAANRDEFHQRATRPLHWWDWPAGPLAGRDLEAGGTWLAVRRGGRFAALTNFRDPSAGPGSRSRGTLPLIALDHDRSPERHVHDIYQSLADFAPFTLLVGDRESLWMTGTRVMPERVQPGVHALSNHLLDTPWPKSTSAVERLERQLAGPDPYDLNGLLDLLDDRAPAPDGDLPDTGVGPQLERMLSAPFVISERYGTRSSSALVLGRRARMAERCFDPAGQRIGQRVFGWNSA